MFPQHVFVILLWRILMSPLTDGTLEEADPGWERGEGCDGPFGIHLTIPFKVTQHAA